MTARNLSQILAPYTATTTPDPTPEPETFDQVFAEDIAKAEATHGAATVDAQLLAWQRRDVDESIILKFAPAPTLPCPSWCELPSGHGWDWYTQHGDLSEDVPANVSRDHHRTMLDGGPHVNLRRTDWLDLEGGGERVKYSSAVYVEAVGGERTSADEAQGMARALQESHDLLVAGYAAGDLQRGDRDDR